MAEKTNKEMMVKDFATIGEDASMKDAFQAIRKNLAGPPHSPGLVVLHKNGRCAGVLTVDDFMRELSRLYGEACDKPGKKDWGDKFFNQCEIAGAMKASSIMSGKGIAVDSGAVFDQSCELILSKNLNLLPVIDAVTSKVVGIITRRMALEELAPKLFK
jgi:predicted transcriptional regulator